jgi:pyruvate/2-oxoglutarate/acetoin dehydrogenase E1 component
MKPQHVIHKFAGGSYFNELRRSMAMLAGHPKSLFLGQSIVYESSSMFRTLETQEGIPLVPMSKRIELPVIEDFQMGVCIGLALQGYLPICIFPRIDFMLLAMDQLVNHLDKLPLYGWKPKVIIRTTVGQKKPLDAGPQHTQNHAHAFRQMLTTVEVLEVCNPRHVAEAYALALSNKHSTLIVENPCSS